MAWDLFVDSLPWLRFSRVYASHRVFLKVLSLRALISTSLNPISGCQIVHKPGLISLQVFINLFPFLFEAVTSVQLGDVPRRFVGRNLSFLSRKPKVQTALLVKIRMEATVS